MSPLLSGAALGALDEVDANLVARHLLTCTRCRPELDRYTSVVDVLAFAAPQVPPSPQLRDRLLSNLDEPTSRVIRPRWQWAALAAASLVVMLLAGNLALLLRGTNDQTQSTPTARSVAVSAPIFVWYDLNATEPQVAAAHGILCAQQSGSVAWLIVQDLPPLPEGKIYQAWLTHGDQRDSAGLFTVDSQGRGFLTIRLQQPLDSYSLLGVTEEPAGGSEIPTGARLLSGSL